jgi:hypothetical protein
MTLDGKAASPELLKTQWLELAAKASRETPNVEDGAALAIELSKTGPDALNPLYDTLADKSSSPYAKAMTTTSLMGLVTPNQMPRIVGMTTPGNDVTTRVCATSLLGSFPPDNAEAGAALNGLKNDTDRQVRFQALRGLASRSLDDKKAFGDLYRLPETSQAEKQDILSVLSFGSIAEVISIFHDAAKDVALDDAGRVLAIQTLGRTGNQDSLAVLKDLFENESHPPVKNAAKTALDGLEEQMKSRAALKDMAVKQQQPATPPAAAPAPAPANQ